uniref:Uncharacterized protein n=1 Tax=Anguilla anguilla TaxID=7936 RepID=A0A0E9T8V6_ANGAN
MFSLLSSVSHFVCK